MPEERVFFDDDGTYVSNTKIVIGGTTYATANITSVSKNSTPPSTGCAVALVVLGATGVLAGLLLMTDNFSNGIAPLLISLVIAGLGVLWNRSLKADYHVVLRSASGETRGLTSKDQARVDRVVSAIGDAITSRG
jgi:hypothetical protein